MDSRPEERLLPLSIPQEEDLVRRAQAGERAAFAALYRAHIQPIYRYVFLRTSNSQLAEDLTADVFLRAVEGLPRYTNRGLPFGAWLFRIARDRVVDHYRRTTRRPVAELDEGLVSEVPGPGARVEGRDEVASLYDALRSLTDEQRDVIQLRFMEARSLAETARAMDRSINAVKALQHRALAALGRLLQGQK
jgi:RNA polymerase sigma-70 factor (ECF subfamily)